MICFARPGKSPTPITKKTKPAKTGEKKPNRRAASAAPTAHGKFTSAVNVTSTLKNLLARGRFPIARVAPFGGMLDGEELSSPVLR